MSRIRDIANILSANTAMATDAEVASSIASHAAAADPHTGYLKESEFNATGKNFVINGAFDIFQRTSTPSTGITVTGGNGYTADRWNVWNTAPSGSIVLSRQSSGVTGIQYCARFQRPAGNTSGLNFFGQPIETSNSILLAGKTITLSFYARKGADYSDAASALQAQVWQNTTTDASLQTMESGNRTTAIGGTATLTTSWQRFVYTGSVLSTSTQLAVAFYGSTTGTAGANDWYEITGIQLEVGSTASHFSRAGGTIGAEVLLCQRYFQTILNSSEAINGFENFGIGLVWASNRVLYNRIIPVTMRTSPAISLSTVGDITIENASTGGQQATNYDFFDYSPRNFSGSFYCAGTPFTVGQGARMRASATTNSRIYLSSEL